VESHLARNASLGEWWNSDGNTKVSAKDQLALCNALLWSYIDDEDMIGDPVVLNRLVFLHFTICSLVQEITFPQWYTEEEFTELEADFTFVAVECNWLQSLLQSHSELPGVGFNIIKFHDFLSIPSIMRELGCIMSADTSTMEMRMKDLKLHDKFVKKLVGTKAIIRYFCVLSHKIWMMLTKHGSIRVLLELVIILLMVVR
jgi:hypothetical protein